LWGRKKESKGKSKIDYSRRNIREEKDPFQNPLISGKCLGSPRKREEEGARKKKKKSFREDWQTFRKIEKVTSSPAPDPRANVPPSGLFAEGKMNREKGKGG